MNQLYFVLTIDGDWSEYFLINLPEESRKPDKKFLLSLIDCEMRIASAVNGRFLHFIHNSPLVRDFFLEPEFVNVWREIEAGGGEIGIHCHEERLYSRWYYDDQTRMEQSISTQVKALRRHGLSPRSYRGGYMAFSPKLIPILEKNELFLDFSCDPGRYMVKNNQLVSDWRKASDNFYRMSYDDQNKAGDSRVFEIPLGFYLEHQSLWFIWKKARQLNRKKKLQVVSVLAHTYDFTSSKMMLKIKLALSILKRYGTFINSNEALKIVTEGV